MAEIKIEHGWLKLVHELFAALACAGFSKWEWVVLREVFDQVFGIGQRETAKLSASDIANRIGTHREAIVRAIRTLGESGVLIRQPDGEFVFVKDYERWQIPFTDKESSYIKAAKPTKKSKKDRNRFVPVHDAQMTPRSDTARNQEYEGQINKPPEQQRSGTGTPALHPPEQQRSGTGTPALQNRNTGVPPSHYIEPARGIEKGEKGECVGTPPPPDFIPPNNDPKEVARIAALAEERWPAQDADYFVGDLCRTFPIAIIQEVLDRAFDRFPKMRLDGPKRKWVRTTCDGLVADKWTPTQRKSHQPSLFDPPAPKLIRAGDPLS